MGEGVAHDFPKKIGGKCQVENIEPHGAEGYGRVSADPPQDDGQKAKKEGPRKNGESVAQGAKRGIGSRPANLVGNNPREGFVPDPGIHHEMGKNDPVPLLMDQATQMIVVGQIILHRIEPPDGAKGLGRKEHRGAVEIGQRQKRIGDEPLRNGLAVKHEGRQSGREAPLGNPPLHAGDGTDLGVGQHGAHDLPEIGGRDPDIAVIDKNVGRRGEDLPGHRRNLVHLAVLAGSLRDNDKFDLVGKFPFELPDQGGGRIGRRIDGKEDPKGGIILVNKGKVVVPGSMVKAANRLDHDDGRKGAVRHPDIPTAPKKTVGPEEGGPVENDAQKSPQKAEPTGQIKELARRHLRRKSWQVVTEADEPFRHPAAWP